MNPGATSTKIAVFDGENEIFSSSVEHAAQDLAHFEHVADQMPYRKALILKALHGKTGAMLVSAIAGEVVMVLGYFAYESLILGYGMAAAASIPGNAIQGAAGIIVGIAAYKALYAIPYVRRLSV